MKNLRQIIGYILPYWGYACLNILFNLLAVVFSLFSITMVIPFLQLLFNKAQLVMQPPPLAFTTDALIGNLNYLLSRVIVEWGRTGALFAVCLSVIVFFFLKNFFRYLAQYLLSPLRNGVVRDMRNQLYDKVLILPISFYTNQRKGDIMARMTTDVKEIEWSIMSALEMVFRDPFTLILYLVTLLMISPQLTLFVIVFLPLTGIVIGRIGKKLNQISLRVQKKMGVILSVVEETISGLRIIKAFNAIDFADEKFRNMDDEYTRLMNRVYRRRDLSAPLTEYLSVLVLVVVIWYGGRLVMKPGGMLTADVFLFFIAVFSQMIVPAKALTTAFYNIQKGLASVERLNKILDAGEVITEKPDALPIKTFSKAIEFRNVNFSYDKEPVLNDINLVIEKGRSVAVVGPSGAGKSTLADLLPRFYDSTSGELLIDGTNVKDYVISDVRGLMGIVSQESILFNDTVLNNIAFGTPEVSEEQVIAAAKVANAHEFIMEMPKGYQTNIGDRGIKMSGGQRQRISIARAVLKNPPVLLLDEATSALDTESERLVQEALSKLMLNRTSLVIAHRLSTIQHADEIIVLGNGRITERGTHGALMELGGEYKKLVDLQSFD